MRTRRGLPRQEDAEHDRRLSLLDLPEQSLIALPHGSPWRNAIASSRGSRSTDGPCIDVAESLPGTRSLAEGVIEEKDMLLISIIEKWYGSRPGRPTTSLRLPSRIAAARARSRHGTAGRWCRRRCSALPASPVTTVPRGGASRDHGSPDRGQHDPARAEGSCGVLLLDRRPRTGWNSPTPRRPRTSRARSRRSRRRSGMDRPCSTAVFSISIRMLCRRVGKMSGKRAGLLEGDHAVREVIERPGRADEIEILAEQRRRPMLRHAIEG